MPDEESKARAIKVSFEKRHQGSDDHVNIANLQSILSEQAREVDRKLDELRAEKEQAI